MPINVLKNTWPEWTIEEKPIGRGSYGAVYRATRRDYNVESQAAIKIISIPTNAAELDSLRAEGLDNSASRTYLENVVNDFVNEIQLLISLEGSSNIVDVKDYKVVEKEGELGWHIFLRMELLTPFDAYIRDRQLTEKEVIKLGCDICNALEICGREKIIHRDIKPGNILVHKSGSFKLCDFGIAKKLENNTAGLSKKYTYNYAAPEVVNGCIYDARVDTYSLGIVLYRLLNDNILPFLDKESALNPQKMVNAVERRIQGEPLPAPCNASARMAGVILKACAHDPNMRYASATEMKQALLRVGNEAAAAPVKSKIEPSPAPAKKDVSGYSFFKPAGNLDDAFSTPTPSSIRYSAPAPAPAHSAVKYSAPAPTPAPSAVRYSAPAPAPAPSAVKYSAPAPAPAPSSVGYSAPTPASAYSPTPVIEAYDKTVAVRKAPAANPNSTGYVVESFDSPKKKKGKGWFQK